MEAQTFDADLRRKLDEAGIRYLKEVRTILASEGFAENPQNAADQAMTGVVNATCTINPAEPRAHVFNRAVSACCHALSSIIFDSVRTEARERFLETMCTHIRDKLSRRAIATARPHQ